MAARIPVQQIKSWSFSRYSDYKQCPLKAKLKHIDKIKEPPNKAMERGTEIHNKAEFYIKGKIGRLPKELKEFANLFKWLRKQYKKAISGMTVEETWAYTKKWDETAWNDWTGCWLRIKMDCAFHEDDDATMIIKDWKTGKFRPENVEELVEQLELYALGAMILHEHIEKVKPMLVYLDQGTTYPTNSEDLVFTRKDIPRLRKVWEKRVRPMFNDKKFPPRPNDRCCWCFFRKSNKANGGGQCRY